MIVFHKKYVEKSDGNFIEIPIPHKEKKMTQRTLSVAISEEKERSEKFIRERFLSRIGTEDVYHIVADDAEITGEVLFLYDGKVILRNPAGMFCINKKDILDVVYSDDLTIESQILMKNGGIKKLVEFPMYDVCNM